MKGWPSREAAFHFLPWTWPGHMPELAHLESKRERSEPVCTPLPCPAPIAGFNRVPLEAPGLWVQALGSHSC